MKPRLLDLFCGAGGCAKRYQRAGFYVVGVDNRPQPNYCGDEFVQDDALALMSTFPWWDVAPFDAIHASPPCQWYSAAMKTATNAEARERHTPMIEAVRDALVATDIPYVIENVEGARKWMRDPVMICGSSLDLHVRRHRLFEASFPLLVPPCAHGLEETREARYITTTRVRTGRKALAPFVNPHATGARFNTDALRDAMGVDWMTRTTEIREAIPPAYTELIGHQLLQHVRARAAA